MRIVWLLVLPAFLYGCTQTDRLLDDPLPLSKGKSHQFVTPPLHGVDSLVIEGLLGAFDSTFVDAESEAHALERFLEGKQLILAAESLLVAVIDSSSARKSDSLAFSDAVPVKQELSTEMLHAQSQSIETVQLRLSTAQGRLEEAISFNPWHEESKYELAHLYAIRASYFGGKEAWEKTLELLQELVLFRVDEHGLWSEMAVALDHLGRFSDAAMVWDRAAKTILRNVNLSFDDAVIDSAEVFTYSLRSYRSSVKNRSGEGVYLALIQALEYATTTEKSDFVKQELEWAQWDDFNLEHRLVFDSLKSVALESPMDVIAELEVFIPDLKRSSARWEANYHYAVLSYENGFDDRALTILQTLWQDVTEIDPNANKQHMYGNPDLPMISSLPYPQFREDLALSYATVLFERALSYRQDGQYGLAYNYLMRVVETKSKYIGKAYIEALKLARYSPEQALEIEPEVEAIFDDLEREDQLAYLMEIGSLYRRMGKRENVNIILARIRAIRNQPPN